MTEMVTRIARVLMESDTDFESYVTVAVRILEAMWAPTEDMFLATGAVYNKGQAREVWQAMIGAALSEDA